ncbi:unnamed protein product [Rotaria magnacalcarata]|uniref:Uncharacterized protein n=1 Tax=Rotaria magnacalcarata TaxID=392030 RepID=A0A819M3D5_9BILA|nr:unnamed protein product [Rotaria magnacalcarata]CAF4105574.1 unnamed protein product [Rotaria magnacalcarata]
MTADNSINKSTSMEIPLSPAQSTSLLLKISYSHDFYSQISHEFHSQVSLLPSCKQNSCFFIYTTASLSLKIIFSGDFHLQVTSIYSSLQVYFFVFIGETSLLLKNLYFSFIDQHHIYWTSTSLPLGIMHSEDFDLLVDMTFTENYFHDFHLQVTSPYSS